MGDRSTRELLVDVSEEELGILLPLRLPHHDHDPLPLHSLFDAYRLLFHSNLFHIRNCMEEEGSRAAGWADVHDHLLLPWGAVEPNFLQGCQDTGSWEDSKVLDALGALDNMSQELQISMKNKN